MDERSIPTALPAQRLSASLAQAEESAKGAKADEKTALAGERSDGRSYSGGRSAPGNAARRVRGGKGEGGWLAGRWKHPRSERVQRLEGSAAAIYEVQPFHLGMFQGDELAAVQFRFSEFFSSIDSPVRILALSEPYSLGPAVRSVEDQISLARSRWRRSGLMNYRRFLEELRDTTGLHGIKYFLQAWLSPDVQPATLQGLASSAFMTRVREIPSTSPFFHGGYAEELDYLVPLTPGEPYLCVLTSWDLRGIWDLFTTHALLQLDFPVGLAVDVETYAPDRAHITLMNSYNALEAQLGTAGRMGRDTRSETAYADCDYAMKAVDSGQRLHRVSVALLVKGQSLAELQANVQMAERVMISKLRMRVERGSQLEALKLFTPTPTGRINCRLTRRTAVSEGVSVIVPYGLRRRNSTRGILWGIDADGGYPVFYNGWQRQSSAGTSGEAGMEMEEDGALEHSYGAQDRSARALHPTQYPLSADPADPAHPPDPTSPPHPAQMHPAAAEGHSAGMPSGTQGASAYHHVIVGETGSGKTYGANVLLYREALQGTQVVVLEPMGHSRRLMQAMGSGGSYNRLDFAGMTVNLLDVVEASLADQVTHVQRALAVLLSSASGGAGGAAGSAGSMGNAGAYSSGSHTAAWGGRRVFSNAELASLGAAMRDLYARHTFTEAPLASYVDAPRLEDLCAQLRRNSLRADRADRADRSDALCGSDLADEIAGLYVDGVYGGIFNPKHGTSLDLRVEAPGVAYDFSGVNETFRPLLYSQVLAAVQRRVRSPRRAHPMIVFIDEFRYMAQEPILAEQAMLLVKTARTYRAAIWMAEQNLFTFAETFTGRAIIENTPIVTLYRQTATATKIARDLYPRLTEYHSFLLGTSRRGECITLLGDDIFHMQMHTSLFELASFSGS